jgi:hypothetical protein
MASSSASLEILHPTLLESITQHDKDALLLVGTRVMRSSSVDKNMLIDCVLQVSRSSELVHFARCIQELANFAGVDIGSCTAQTPDRGQQVATEPKSALESIFGDFGDLPSGSDSEDTSLEQRDNDNVVQMDAHAGLNVLVGTEISNRVLEHPQSSDKNNDVAQVENKSPLEVTALMGKKVSSRVSGQPQFPNNRNDAPKAENKPPAKAKRLKFVNGKKVSGILPDQSQSPKELPADSISFQKSPKRAPKGIPQRLWDGLGSDDEGFLDGAVFLCSKATQSECFERKLFGAPLSNRMLLWKKIVPGKTSLFLLNVQTKTLWGPFFADSVCEINLEPTAWNPKNGSASTTSPYPVQVRVGFLKAGKLRLHHGEWHQLLPAGNKCVLKPEQVKLLLQAFSKRCP